MDIIIIGAGAAGLSAAKTLLKQPASVISSVKIVEALSYIGGRIKADDQFVPGHRVDLGAEYIHGFETMLTDVVDESKDEWESRLDEDDELLEDIFIIAHADGGPDGKPTKNGEYGVYYLGKEDTLLRYDTDDADFQYLSEAIDNLKWEIEDDENDFVEEKREEAVDISLGAYLDEHIEVPSRMSGILESGFGNTAACTDLYKISLSSTIDFEKYWEENEVAGDTRLHSKIGMVGVVDSIVEKHLKDDERFSIHLNWTVASISRDSNGVTFISKDGTMLKADKAIVTVPPSVITSNGINFEPPLPTWKLDAYKMVGMEGAIKIIVKFNKKVWPEKVQNVIAGDMQIPEIWFRSMKTKVNDSEYETCHLAVGFLTSKAADNLVHLLEGCVGQDRNEKAAQIVLLQLSQMFKFDKLDVDDAYVSAIIYDWKSIPSIKGGYMYPKVGIERRHFHRMAKSIDSQLFFAGEATNTGACCTVQAAMETGKRAADEITCCN